ncbi:cell wall / vacuolar inhibitor of fructosidase 2-like [Rutidosis leptorrhynchoides]|uniref:cell wall / vacuolar inhibitor of fructosidase 2-like n=1 Tax=Rutidosis leptorrhynchoides TaxID=125765 RepID=UPI003A98FF1C
MSMAILKPNYNILLLPLLLITLLFLIPILGNPQTDELINKICRSTEDYEFCYKIFHENMKSPSTHIVGLARITIDEATNNASNNLYFVGKLVRQEKDEKKWYLLMQCIYGYDQALGTFQLASDYLNRRDFKQTLSAFWNAPFQLRNYTSLFSMTPIGARNEQMRKLMGMAILTGLNF